MPDTVAELRVKGAFPDDVNVTESDLEVPSTRLPKLSEAALRVRVGVVAVPVPLNATVAVEPVVEVLPMVKAPVTVPAVVGAKVTGTTRVWPTARVLGKVVAAIENPDPVTASDLIVTAAVPDEVRVTESDLDVPSVMLPNGRLVALRINCGVAAVPVPVRATVEVGFVVDVLTTVSLPVTAPAVVGAKVTGTTSV